MTGPIALKELTVVLEPGYGTVAYLSGLSKVAERGTNRAEMDPPQDPRQWSYGMGRAAALEGLFGAAFEDILVDTEKRRLKPSFSALQSFSIRLWDPYEGEEHAWWLDETVKHLPTLQAMGLLRVQVSHDCEYLLCGAHALVALGAGPG